MKTSRSITVDEVPSLLESSRSVIIVPGYGMAVAQAQHAVAELGNILVKKGIDVKYAIHPVAGRMPGHMNVLLAEANIPYDRLFEMERINPYFPEADLVLVIGANDVTNPAAKHDRTSPLYGMPILEVDRARAIIVLKRSMRPGFAGVENELYYDPKCMMLFGDAKESHHTAPGSVQIARISDNRPLAVVGQFEFGARGSDPRWQRDRWLQSRYRRERGLTPSPQIKLTHYPVGAPGENRVRD